MNPARIEPAISIIVATYNRSAALKCALSSAVGQTFGNWELLVVGDACTDDTAQVVESINDSRIQFLNLACNIGEQSGPNNVGVRRTVAPLIAFLNHDDLWFPDHLEHALAALQARNADLVFSPNFTLSAKQRPDDPLWLVVDSLSRRGQYDPGQTDTATPASSWLLRREAYVRLGGWRAASEIRTEPSQDFLFRAYRAGMRMWSTGVPTVITIASGSRLNSYLGNQADEQELFLARLSEPGLRLELLSRDVTPGAAGRPPDISRRRRMWFGLIRRASSLGVSPRYLDFVIRRRLHAGQQIRLLRGKRGLMADVDAGSSVQAMRRREVLAACQIPPDNGAISFRAEGNGLRYCARGWSAAEHWGTWNDGATAELAFRNEGSCDSEMTLQLVVQAYVNDNSRTQRMNLRVGEWSRTTSLATEGPHHVEVPLGVLTMHPTIVNFEFPDACSPSVHDPRRIAVGLTSAELVIRADDTGACG